MFIQWCFCSQSFCLCSLPLSLLAPTSAHSQNYSHMLRSPTVYKFLPSHSAGWRQFELITRGACAYKRDPISLPSSSSKSEFEIALNRPQTYTRKSTECYSRYQLRKKPPRTHLRFTRNQRQIVATRVRRTNVGRKCRLVTLRRRFGMPELLTGSFASLSCSKVNRLHFHNSHLCPS